MRGCMNNRYFGAAFVGVAALWMTISPATAESSAAAAAKAEKQKATDEANKNCDCPCENASKDVKKSRVIYVGPRQNIPLEIDEG